MMPGWLSTGWKTIGTNAPKLAKAIDNFEKKELATSSELEIKNIRWIQPLCYSGKDHRYPDIKPTIVEIQFGGPGKMPCQQPSALRAFYLLYPEMDAGDHPETTPPVSIKTFPLDGISLPFHEINKLLGSIDMEHAAEYLDLFTSFLTGEESIFTIITSTDAICWVDWKDEQTYFNAEVVRRVYNIFKEDIAAQHPGLSWNDATVKGMKEVIGADISGWIGIRPADEQLLRKMTYNGLPEDTIPEYEEEYKQQFEEFLSKIKKGYHQKDPADPDPPAYFMSLVQYERNLFLSFLSVARTGNVEMLDDQPLRTEYSPLPIGKWSFLDDPRLDYGKMLSFEPYAAPLDIVEKSLEQWRIPPLPSLTPDFYGEKDPDLSWMRRERFIQVRNGQQEGGLGKANKTRGHTYFGPIEFVDIDFLGPVDFDDAMIEKSIEFKRCQFLEPVKFRNANIGGNLRFIECQFWGLPPLDMEKRSSTEEEQVFNEERDFVLLLDGIDVTGEILIERSDFHGSVGIRSAHIGGKVRFNGNHLFPLYNFLDKGRSGIQIDRRHANGVALDIRGSRFDSGLDLSAWFKPGPSSLLKISEKEKEDCRPTVISGQLRGEASHIGGELLISGIIMGTLNRNLFIAGYTTGISFRGARVAGSVSLWVYDKHPLGNWHLLGAFAGHYVDFALANITGNLDLRGIWIDGDLDCSSLRCDSHAVLSCLVQYDIDRNSGNNFGRCYIDRHNGRPKIGLPPQLIVRKKEGDGTRKTQLARFARSHVMRDANFSYSTIRGMVLLNGTYFGGKIFCNGGEYGSLSCCSYKSVLIGDFEIGLGSRLPDYLPEEEEPTAGNEKDQAEFLRYLKTSSTIKFHVVANETEPEEGKVQAPPKPQLLIIRPTASALEIMNTTIRGDIYLGGLWLDKDPADEAGEDAENRAFFEDHSSLVKWSRSEEKDRVHPQIEQAPKRPSRLIIENADIRGSLYFIDQSAYGNYEHWLDKQPGQIQYRGNQIVQSYLKTSENKTATFGSILQDKLMDGDSVWIAGDLQIDNSTIDGKLDLSNMLVSGKVSIRDVSVSGDIMSYSNTNITRDTKAATDRPLYAFAIHFELEMVACDGDIRLDGITTLLDFSGKNLVVKGESEFFMRRLGSSPRRLIVGRKLDLTGSRFTRLSLKDTRPVANRNDKRDDRIWVLKGMQAQHVDIFTIDDGPKEDAFVDAIDFQDSHFTQITVNGRDEDLAMLKGLLRRTHPFTTDPYALVERSLRTLGRQEEANKIYAAKERCLRNRRFNRSTSQSEWKEKGFIRGSFSFLGKLLFHLIDVVIFDWCAGFGSSWRRLLSLGIILLLVCCFFLTGIRANYEFPGSVPRTDSTITAFSILKKAINITVPLVEGKEKDAGESKQLRTKGVTYTILSGGPKQPGSPGYFRNNFTFNCAPDDFAWILGLIGWIIWPMFALSVTGFLKRE